MGRRRGRCVKRNKQLNNQEKEELVKAPHSFVIHRGLPGEHIIELTKDFRRVMEPFTASELKERRRNTIKDFVAVAGIFHVTHLCIFSRTENGMYLKICRLPRGPTLVFKINNFSLSRDVISMAKKQYVFEEIFKSSPLVILNNFSGEGMHFKLMAQTFQNMFPAINLTTVKLSSIRRCVCLNYNPDSKLIDYRHYAIKVVPVGLSKNVKKIIQAKIPNLSKCQDFSDFLSKATASDSEAEDDSDNHVTLSQKLSSRGNQENNKSSIKLFELGPRISMQLMKIEVGLLEGEVLYHDFIEKTEEEKLLIEKRREQKKKLKEKRKKIQEENKRKKEAKKEELKMKSLEGMKKKRENDMLLQKIAKESYEESKTEDDDAQYYREEVGEEPDKELFDKAVKKRKSNSLKPKFKSKKVKIIN